jgi:hypothetical protein
MLKSKCSVSEKHESFDIMVLNGVLKSLEIVQHMALKIASNTHYKMWGSL